MIKNILLILCMSLFITTFSNEIVKMQKVTKYDILKHYASPELYELYYAMITVESNWNENAVSPTNDHGLMQINKPTWSKKFDFDRIYDPTYNINVGIYIFENCLAASNGDIHAALIKYNGSKSYPYKIYAKKMEIFGDETKQELCR